MSDHLPECHVRPKGFTSTSSGLLDWLRKPKPHPNCICDRLRACEQRVREDDQRILIKHGAQQFVRGEEIGKAMGYAAGVQAARDAVAARLCSTDGWGCDHCYEVNADLAAINALREPETWQAKANRESLRGEA